MRLRRLAGLTALCLLIRERSVSFAQPGEVGAAHLSLWTSEAVSTLRAAAAAGGAAGGLGKPPQGSKRPDEDQVLGAVLRVQKEKTELNKALQV